MLNWIPWWGSSLISNVAIIQVEYVNHLSTGSWTSVLPKTAPAFLMAQYFLFRNFSEAPSWFEAWAVFTLGNAVMRVASVSLLAGNEVARWDLALGGITIMMVGSLVLKKGLA